MRLSPRFINVLLGFSTIFCWFFALMLARTTLQSQSNVEIVLKGVLVGMGIWCGLGLLKRRSQVLWFAIALCIYAIYGSLVWLYYSLLLPAIYSQPLTFGLYEYLSFLYIVGGSIVIWFLLCKQTRDYLGCR